METNPIDLSKANGKRKFASKENASTTKKKKNDTDKDDGLGIDQLSDDVLIKIIKMVPMAQWASLESVNKQFQQATFAVWRSINEIKLDEHFVYNRREFQNNRYFVLNSILAKLFNRSPQITTISGFFKFNSSYVDGFGILDFNIDFLAKFIVLQKIDFTDAKISLINLDEFLIKSKSRGRLKDICLPSYSKEESFRSGFSELRDRPLLKLEKLEFARNFASFRFLRSINASKLTKLKFTVTYENFENFITFINRCEQLRYVDINYTTSNEWTDVSREQRMATDLLRSILMVPRRNLFSLKLNMAFSNLDLQLVARLVKFITQLGERHRLTDFTFVCHQYCNNDVILAIAKNLPQLTSLELEVDSDRCDSGSLSYLVSRLTNLEKLAFYGDEKRRGVDGNVISAVATNLHKLKTLYLDYPIKGKSEMLNCLIGLSQLKELRIKNGPMSIKTLKAWNGFGGRLESLELPNCNQVNDAGLIVFIKKQLRLRRLNLKEAQISDKTLYAIGSFCPFLRELNLFHCLKITLAGVQAVIDGCPMLKRLDTYLTGVPVDQLKMGKFKVIDFL